MAGIGFALRAHLADDTFTGTFRAYGYAGVIGAGPWVLSILGIMLVGALSVAGDSAAGSGSGGADGLAVERFTTSVTWLMATSLVLTGLLQLVFTRWVADRTWEGREHLVNPNLFGAMALTTLASAGLGTALALTLFEEPLAYEALMVANLALLSNVWIVVIFVAGLRRFRLVLGAFAVGYGATVLLCHALSVHGLPGLLAGLLGGHAALLFLMLGAVVPAHTVALAPRADFLRPDSVFGSLIAVGLFYNLGIWIDKLLFWLDPSTSEAVIGPLRSSLIYDLPIFLSYLAVIPGMAVFLLRIETDFAEAHARFFDAVAGGAGLEEIESLGDRMVGAVRDGLFQICRVQGATVLAMYLLGPRIVAWLGISPAHVHLYYVDLVGVAAQVLVLAILNVLFYLDRRDDALMLTALMLGSNALLTWASLELGPQWYGYGFGLAMTGTALAGLVTLSRRLERIEFATFMRERPTPRSTVR